VIATGYNVVDLQYTRERNIMVSNVPNYCTASVAQMMFAHTLNLCRRVAYHAQTARQGKWSEAQEFCYWDFPQIDLTGKTLGLIGCGNIGRAVARIAQAMDMKVIGYDPYAHEMTGIRRVDLDTVFGTSDIVSLHCPLTEETQGIINMANIKKMKRTAFLINTSRGPLINETDLAKALEEGLIAGAGLDVLSVEPPQMDNPLLSARNCFLTPHIAWASQEARAHLIELTANNVRSYLSGKPINVVNGL